jgi:hypothetical protein
MEEMAQGADVLGKVLGLVQLDMPDWAKARQIPPQPKHYNDRQRHQQHPAFLPQKAPKAALNTQNEADVRGFVANQTDQPGGVIAIAQITIAQWAGVIQQR